MIPEVNDWTLLKKRENRWTFISNSGDHKNDGTYKMMGSRSLAFYKGCKMNLRSIIQFIWAEVVECIKELYKLLKWQLNPLLDEKLSFCWIKGLDLQWQDIRTSWTSSQHVKKTVIRHLYCCAIYALFYVVELRLQVAVIVQYIFFLLFFSGNICQNPFKNNNKQ